VRPRARWFCGPHAGSNHRAIANWNTGRNSAANGWAATHRREALELIRDADSAINQAAVLRSLFFEWW